MKLIVVAGESEPGELPELHDEITDIILVAPAPDSVIEWATQQPTFLTVVSKNASDIDDRLLELVVTIVEDPRPHLRAAQFASRGDLAFLAWNDSDEHHAVLEFLSNVGVPVLDIGDGYVELVLDRSVDVEALVARVTASVLKTVRGEIADLLRTRRRSGNSKV